MALITSGRSTVLRRCSSACKRSAPPTVNGIADILFPESKVKDAPAGAPTENVLLKWPDAPSARQGPAWSLGEVPRGYALGRPKTKPRPKHKPGRYVPIVGNVRENCKGAA